MVDKLKKTMRNMSLSPVKISKQITSLVPYINWRPQLSGEIVRVKKPVADPTSETVLEALTSFRSISGNKQQIHEAIEYIERFLSERALYVKRYESNGIESVVATTRNNKHPKVLLLGHVDVVPAGDSMFTLRKSNHTYIGRGVLDMKGPIASMLMAIDKLKDNIHDYDFGIMITGDEETSGYNGARVLVELEGYSSDVVVCPDGATNWALQHFAKGIWHIEVQARGKTAHGSRPWEGESATERLMEVLRDIRAIFDHSEKKNSTINIGTLKAGEARNQIADFASAGIDIRFASNEDVTRIKKAVTETCKRHNVDLKSDAFSPPCVNDPNDPYLKDFLDTITDVIGYNPGTTISYALDDARYFNGIGVPCAVFSPKGGGHHGPEEWLPIVALDQMQSLFVKYLEKRAR